MLSFLLKFSKKKTYLRLANKNKRLRWAKEHRHWTLEYWKKVLWTDESKFEIFGSNRRTFVRRRTNEKMLEQCILSSVKHGGGSTMDWGCFRGGKIGDLYRVEKTLRKESYHEILQQDNDPRHTSKIFQ